MCVKNHDYRKRVELEDKIRFLLNENKKLKGEVLVLKSNKVSGKCACDVKKSKK